MILIHRTIQAAIEEVLYKGKVVVIYGARQVGKTTLLKMIQEKYPSETVYLNCDEPDIRESLSEKTSPQMKSLFGTKTLVLIDEAQRVKNIGISLKLIVDNYPSIQVIATGSSSFDLSNDISEPLTGRKFEFFLYPLSVEEIKSQASQQEMERLLERYMRFGMYPGIVSSDAPAELLKEIATSYLFKDILEYQTVKNPEILRQLLQALALQVGSEVSFNELAVLLHINRSTVTRYISLLEQGYVIFHISPYSKNLRNEIGRMRKIYFYDVGIRNALINNFNPLNIRQDTGMLWENFFASERRKWAHNHRKNPNIYFWRDYDGREIDYLEEENGQLIGFECKWKAEKWRKPKSFLNAYPGSQLNLINQQTIWKYL